LKSRLFYKIFGSYFLIVVLSLLVIGFLISRKIESGIIAEIRGELYTKTRLLTLFPREEITKKISFLAEISHARLTLIDASGRVTADSEQEVDIMDNHFHRPEIQEARIKDHGENIRYSHTLGVDMLYIAYPIREGGNLKGYVRLAYPLHEIKRSTDQLYKAVFSVILLVTVFPLLISLLLSRKFILPIREMESFTGKVCRGLEPGALLIDTKDETGKLAANINCMLLMHENKIISAAVAHSKLESAFESMIEGVMVLDNRKRIESINRGMRNIIAQHYPADVIGKTPLEVFRNVDLQNALEEFNEEKIPISREINLDEEASIVLSVNVSLIHGLPRNEEKIMLVFHDITRLKKLEKVRDNFVANVTHEIRTPLTAIIGFIETLQDGAIDDKATAKKFLRTIEENAHRLNRLVDDLLTLSSIELGDVELQLEEISVNDTVDHVIPLLEARVSEKKQVLRKIIPEGLPHILADKDRIIQVLLNVLDNAVKFTPDGGTITISAGGEGTGFLAIRIIDEGAGIPGNELSRLGERFYRVDKTRSRELGGTGLGLSIVKHLMKAHGGKMVIESKIGQGTTVSLYFPTVDPIADCSGGKENNDN
jgi:two-component system, OmpR family, phosphate regulon sensor histidine kinase PhoR